jgi:hypothetical protein
MRELMPRYSGPTPVGAALSLAGDVDGAIEVMEPVLDMPDFGPFPFFLPPWATLRRDPRFMAMLARTGVIEYWRETGKWADFCDEPDLPYNCEAEAARVSPP